MRQAISVWLVMLFMGLVAVETADAEDISGIISTTKFITENSKLVGDVGGRRVQPYLWNSTS